MLNPKQQARFEMVDEALEAARQEEEKEARGAGDAFVENGVFLGGDLVDPTGYPTGFAWVVGDSTAVVMFSCVTDDGKAKTDKVVFDCTTQSGFDAVESLAGSLLAMARRGHRRLDGRRRTC